VSTDPQARPDEAPEAPADGSTPAAAEALTDLLKTMSSLPSFGAAPAMNRETRRAMKRAKRKKGK
jgi:hypothetical protein